MSAGGRLDSDVPICAAIPSPLYFFLHFGFKLCGVISALKWDDVQNILPTVNTKRLYNYRLDLGM